MAIQTLRVVVLVLLAACPSKEERQQRARARTEVIANASAINVTAAALQNAYDANEVAADDLYKGKVLVVSGVVDSINKDIMDDPYVVLRTKAFAGVRCHFNDTGTLGTLRKRQKVTFKCRGGTYILGSPTLDDCVADYAGNETTAKTSEATEAIAKVSEFADSMCRCTNKACADHVQADLTEWSTDMAAKGGAHDEPSEVDKKRMTTLGQRYAKCMTSVMSSSPRPASDAKGARRDRFVDD